MFAHTSTIERLRSIRATSAQRVAGGSLSGGDRGLVRGFDQGLAGGLCRVLSRGLAVIACLAVVVLSPHKALAQQSDPLAQCMALSTRDDDIHACLDNFLDAMDANLADITDYIRRDFSGAALSAFNRSQAAFEVFRRDNCLWYVEFSAPRSVAEQIGKNCLARFSAERLAELQQLLASDQSTTPMLEGFYVYGASRNSFRPCGSESRYLVAGDANAVGDLQLRYSALASVDLQILFASVAGVVDESIDAGPEHAGVINLASVLDVRLPSESDCMLPVGSLSSSAAASVDVRSASDARLAKRVAEAAALSEESENDVAGVSETASQAGQVRRVNPVADPSSETSLTANALAGDLTDDLTGSQGTTGVPGSSVVSTGEDRLTAYFGAWLADCSVFDGVRQCLLVVDMDGGDATPKLLIYQSADGPTTIELRLPERELESADQILWGIDSFLFGRVKGSELVVTDQLTLQRITERQFVNEELLPLMRKGTDLRVEIGSAANGGARPDVYLTVLSETLTVWMQSRQPIPR